MAPRFERLQPAPSISPFTCDSTCATEHSTDQCSLKYPWEIWKVVSVQETKLVYTGSLLLKVYLDRLDSFQRVLPKGGNLLNNGNRMMETRHTSSWLIEEHPLPWRRSSTSTLWRLHPFIPSINILRNSTAHWCPWRCHHYGHPGSTRYVTRQRAWLAPDTSGSFH